MGLFDKLFTTTQTEVNFQPSSENEAWVAIIYACLRVDGEVSDNEFDMFSRTLVTKKRFWNRTQEVIDSTRKVMDALIKFGVPVKTVIKNSISLVPIENRKQLFAIVADVLLFDGIFSESEKEILEFIATEMELTTEDANNIAQVIALRNKDNQPIA